MSDKFLKSNKAAAYLGVSRSSLTNWVKQGLLKGGLTPGGHYRFTVEELDEFADRRGLIAQGYEAKEFKKNVRILVIEDDMAFREFLYDALEVFKNYEIHETEDGMQGALLVGTWKPNLIILDIRMPNMNGIEFLRMLRQNPETTDIHVIIASAHLSDEVREELIALRADIILDKPVRLPRLIASVQKLVDLELA
jgi:excisionase family DNA binding protein